MQCQLDADAPAAPYFFFFCALLRLFAGLRKPGRAAASVGRWSGVGGANGRRAGAEVSGDSGVSVSSDK